MGPFGRNFGNDYDRDFGRGEWGGRQQGRWDFNAGPWRGNQAYDRGFRDFNGMDRGMDRGGMDRGYDRGFRGDSHLREPFPIRPSHSTHPMQHGSRGGYDHGYFGIDYDREMRGGGRGGYNSGRARYDRNFGDFRNSYLTGWF